MKKSIQNRQELRNFCKTQDYKHMSFFIKPGVEVSLEECEAEVLHALKQFEIDKANGTLVPSNEVL